MPVRQPGTVLEVFFDLKQPASPHMQQDHPLSALIIEKIKGEGPISFRDFMELALYHTEHGYYTSVTDRIGADGDFFTSPYLTGLFGDLLARQFEEMWALLGKVPFTIVEYGAGTGLLCRDILSRLSGNPELYESLNYFIIEKSEAMRQKELRIVPGKVRWTRSIREVGEVTGCIFSNELVDNFSVHRVVMARELMEVYVGYDGNYYELLRPAPAELKDYLAGMGVALREGHCAEINLEA